MIATTPLDIFLYSPSADSDVAGLLEQAGHSVGFAGPDGVDGMDPARCHLVVVDGGEQPDAGLPLCRRLRKHLADHFIPILYITDDPSPAARLNCLESGADAYLLRPFDPAELAAVVRTFVRIKDRHDRLAERTAEVHRINKRLQTAYQQIDQELELAARIQTSFLPRRLPELPQVRFAVHYQPCGRVGGDFYDVFRLDERHLGFYVADAMGHGVPASLLTIFVKKGIKAKEIHGHEYRLVPPSEVVGRLNRDLIDQALSDHPFITMVYAMFDHADGTLQFARAGHPFPVYLPREGPAQLWPVEGTLLGVIEATYPVRAEQVHPGDKVLLYTDGLDHAGGEGRRGIDSLIACAEEHRHLPIAALVRTVAGALFDGRGQADDVTILGMERLG